MRIVYNSATKKIEKVVIAPSTTCEIHCKYHSQSHNCPQCDNCFELDNDQDVFFNKGRYLVNDNDMNNRFLVLQPKKSAVFEIVGCTLVEDAGIYRKYEAPYSGQKDINIAFMDEYGADVFPDKVRLKCSRGALTWVTRENPGKSTSVQWTPPAETVEVTMQLECDSWRQEEYNYGAQLYITLTP